MNEKNEIINFDKAKDILVIEVDFCDADSDIESIRGTIIGQVGGRIPPESILILPRTIRMKGMIRNE